MGLTIHYQLTLLRSVDTRVQRLVERFHAKAEKLHSTRSGVRVLSLTTEAAELDRWACAWLTRRDEDDPETIHAVSVPPIEGCIVPVSIGKGCEPLWLGLCRYPDRTQHGGREVPTGQSAGWWLAGACKTQYASIHGWEHFRQCHSTVVELLRLAVEFGIRLRITDEGRWWPRRSDMALRRALDENNRLVAAVGGALKDCGGDEPAEVKSPIFAHPHFERLEAEGIVERSDAIAAAADEIARLRLRDRDLE